MTHHDNAPRTRGMTAKLSNWWLTDKYGSHMSGWNGRIAEFPFHVRTLPVSFSCKNAPTRTQESRGGPRPTSTSFEVGHSKQWTL